MRGNLIAGLIFLVTFAIFVGSSAPTVYVGDNGELVSSAYLLGIPHPSGYPLFCVSGKLFSFVPLGNIAFRMNVINSAFASASMILLFFLLNKLTNSFLASLTATALFAFSNTFWSQIIVAEVYVLNLLFFISLLFLFLAAGERKKYMYLFMFLFGFGLTNHHTLLLISFPIVLVLILHYLKYRMQFTEISVLMACLVIGVSLYLYLPIRSLANPAIDWGNPETLLNFTKHILRKQYGSFSKEKFAVFRLFEQSLSYFKFLAEQFAIPFFLIVPFGMWTLMKKR